MEMKTKLTFVGILIVALVALVECNRDAERYLDIPEGEELEQARFKELLSILTDGSIQPAEDHQMLLIQLKEALATAEGLRQEVYSHLVSLADDHEHECSGPMLKTLLDIGGLLYNSEEDEVRAVWPYVLFIKRFGESKFDDCLKNFEKDFNKALDSYGQDNIKTFDNLIAAGLDVKRVESDQELYQIAKSFSMPSDEFNGWQMVNVAYSDSQFMKANKEIRNQRELFNKFMKTQCGALQTSLGRLFTLFNLSRSIEKPGAKPVDRSATPVKFLKLNEYNRICLELEKFPTEFEENLAKQMRED